MRVFVCVQKILVCLASASAGAVPGGRGLLATDLQDAAARNVWSSDRFGAALEVLTKPLASNQARLPAEFKHITKRRTRN